MADENSGIPKGPNCAAGIRDRQRIETLEDSDSKQWELLDKLQNRLPTWATLFIACMTGVCGMLLGLVVKGS